jgi:hypothetical protein
LAGQLAAAADAGLTGGVRKMCSTVLTGRYSSQLITDHRTGPLLQNAGNGPDVPAACREVGSDLSATATCGDDA